MSAHPVVQGDTHVGSQIRRTSFQGATKTARFLNTTLIQKKPTLGTRTQLLHEKHHDRFLEPTWRQTRKGAVRGPGAIGCGRCKLAGTFRALSFRKSTLGTRTQMVHEKHHDRFVEPTPRQNAIRRTMCGFNNVFCLEVAQTAAAGRVPASLEVLALLNLFRGPVLQRRPYRHTLFVFGSLCRGLTSKRPFCFLRAAFCHLAPVKPDYGP